MSNFDCEGWFENEARNAGIPTTNCRAYAGASDTETVHGWYDTANNDLIADMSASGQLFLFLGALQPVDGCQVGDESDISATSPTGAAWYSFDASGTLRRTVGSQYP